MAAKNSAQLSTMSTPVAQATQRARPCRKSCCPSPVARHQASSASAPNAQRNHTVTRGCWPASSTNTPMVPSSTPPAMSSHWPSRSRVMALALTGSGVVAGVDAGSLSGAAPLVHRSQSAVSMQIKKLEAALGRPVLLRGPRHLEVTPAGAELLSYARRVLDLQAEAHAALFGPKLAGRVRLGVPDDYASAYLTPVLRSFSHRYQGVEIELTCEQSTSLIPRVVKGELDLALVSQDKPQRGRFLFVEPLVWVG